MNYYLAKEVDWMNTAARISIIIELLIVIMNSNYYFEFIARASLLSVLLQHLLKNLLFC